jgi:aminoglycoside phosphotransferase (APT) family kinase protein
LEDDLLVLPNQEQLLAIAMIHFTEYINASTSLKLQPLSEGFSQAVYSLGAEFVLRVPKTEKAKQHLRNGVAMGKWLQSLNLNWPIDFPRTYQFIEEPVMMALVQRVPGASARCIAASIREQSIDRFAIQLRQLHEQDVEPLRAMGVDAPLYHRVSRDVLMENTRLRMHDAEQGGWLQADMLRTLDAWLQAFEASPDLDVQEVPLHGDLHPMNVMVDSEGTVQAMIDWDDAFIGHPAVDLCLVYAWFPVHARTSFWAIYGDVDDGTKMWARMTAIYIAIHILWAARLNQIEDQEALGRQMLSDAVSE